MASPKKAPRAPILPKELAARALERLDDAELEGCRVEGAALSEQAGERVRLDGVRIVGGTFAATKLAHLAWLDVACERADLSMIEWRGAKLGRVELRASRMTGAKLGDAELDDVRFVECQLDYASFSGARLRQVAFEDCQLREVDFSGADLTGTALVRCDLSGADFTGAKLHGADVSSSTLHEIRVGPGDVRGLVVNAEQATVLARLFGIVVREE